MQIVDVQKVLSWLAGSRHTSVVPPALSEPRLWCISDRHFDLGVLVIGQLRDFFLGQGFKRELWDPSKAASPPFQLDLLQATPLYEIEGLQGGRLAFLEQWAHEPSHADRVLLYPLGYRGVLKGDAKESWSFPLISKKLPQMAAVWVETSVSSSWSYWKMWIKAQMAAHALPPVSDAQLGALAHAYQDDPVGVQNALHLRVLGMEWEALMALQKDRPMRSHALSQFVQAVLAGQKEEALGILKHLQRQGHLPLSVAWALARAARKRGAPHVTLLADLSTFQAEQAGFLMQTAALWSLLERLVRQFCLKMAEAASLQV